MLWRVTAPHFVAGFVTVRGVVKRQAPILEYMANWSDTKAVSYCRSKGWHVEMVK